MKSYSDDIPNISTKDMKKNIEVGAETNELVKANLGAIHDHDFKISEELKTVKGQQSLQLVLLIITLAASLGTLYMTVIHPMLTTTGS